MKVKSCKQEIKKGNEKKERKKERIRKANKKRI